MRLIPLAHVPELGAYAVAGRVFRRLPDGTPEFLGYVAPVPGNANPAIEQDQRAAAGRPLLPNVEPVNADEASLRLGAPLPVPQARTAHTLASLPSEPLPAPQQDRGFALLVVLCLVVFLLVRGGK